MAIKSSARRILLTLLEVKMLKKVLFILATMFFALTVNVTQAKAVTVVELSNFYCPHCYEMQQYHQVIDEEVKATGGSYLFSPIFYGDYPMWVAKAYYSDLSIIAGVNEAIRSVLFSSAVSAGLKLDTPESVCQVLSNQIKAINELDCVRRMNAPDGFVRLGKALRLLDYLIKDKYLGEIVNFPVFVIEMDNQVQQVISADGDKGDKNMSQLAQEVVNAVKGYSHV
jgi:hypothetical protein